MERTARLTTSPCASLIGPRASAGPAARNPISPSGSDVYTNSDYPSDLSLTAATHRNTAPKSARKRSLRRLLDGLDSFGSIPSWNGLANWLDPPFPTVDHVSTVLALDQDNTSEFTYDVLASEQHDSSRRQPCPETIDRLQEKDYMFAEITSIASDLSPDCELVPSRPPFTNAFDSAQPTALTRIRSPLARGDIEVVKSHAEVLSAAVSRLKQASKILQECRRPGTTVDQTKHVLSDIMRLLRTVTWPVRVHHPPHTAHATQGRCYERNASADWSGSSRKSNNSTGEQHAGTGSQIGETIPRIAVSSRPNADPGKEIHCPYFFDPDVNCHYMHPTPRTIISHLQTHGFYFFKDCARYFKGEHAKARSDTHQIEHDNNEHHRSHCVNYYCNNRSSMGKEHLRQLGCKPDFNKLSKKEKFYTMFSILFPDIVDEEYPDWDELVFVYRSSIQANTSGRNLADSQGFLRHQVNSSAHDTFMQQPLEAGHRQLITAGSVVRESEYDERNGPFASVPLSTPALIGTTESGNLERATQLTIEELQRSEDTMRQQSLDSMQIYLDQLIDHFQAILDRFEAIDSTRRALGIASQQIPTMGVETDHYTPIPYNFSLLNNGAAMDSNDQPSGFGGHAGAFAGNELHAHIVDNDMEDVNELRDSGD